MKPHHCATTALDRIEKAIDESILVAPIEDLLEEAGEERRDTAAFEARMRNFIAEKRDLVIASLSDGTLK